MNDYNELIESLRSMEPTVCSTAADAIESLQSRVAELESRLEISPLHSVDGIMARDATIKLQDDRIFELERRLREAEDKKTAGGGSPLKRLQTLTARVAELEAERAEREKQEPVAWVHFPNKKPSIKTLSFSAEPTPQQKAVGFVSRPLYAAPPVTAPVRLTDGQVDKVDEAIREALGDAYDCLRVWNAWSYGTMGPDDFSQVAEDSDRVAEIRNAAAVALGFKVD